MNQLYVYIYPLPCEPPSISTLSAIMEHRAELPVLYNRFPLASYFMQSSVYMPIPLSPRPSTPHGCSLHLCLYSCPGNKFICTIWEQPRCLTTNEWIKKVRSIYTMEYYSATKRNKIGSICRDVDRPKG